MIRALEMSPTLQIAGGLVAMGDGCKRRDILVRDGVIAALGTSLDVAAGTPIFDAADRLILPGLINAHTHGHANLMKGVADRWTLEASLTHGPWLGGARDPKTMYLSTLLGAVDMLSKGCTACFDLVFEFPRPSAAGIRAVAQAYADAGMCAVLAPMVADKTLFAAIPGLVAALPPDLQSAVSAFALTPMAETLVALEDIAELKTTLPKGISLALAPTIPHHCSDSFLAATADLATRHALPIHMHIAESRLQALVGRQLYGRSPVRHLEDLGVLRPGFVAAHAVWLDDDDLDVLARHEALVAHIPASNFRLGSGVADVRAMRTRGITVGLATDGANSSDALSMLEAMRLASYGSRIHAGPRANWLSAAETIDLATCGGAKVLGLADTGTICVGAAADLVFFDLSHIDFMPLNEPLNQVVAAADSRAIAEVMTRGRFVVRDGRVQSVDMGELRAEVEAALPRLAGALAPARALAETIEPHVVAFARSLADEPLLIERLIRPARHTRMEAYGT